MGGTSLRFPIEGQKEKAKTPGFPIKDFGNDGGGGFPPKFQAWRLEEVGKENT